MPLSHANRWILTDTVTSDTYVFPVNPNAMTKPFNRKNLTISPNTMWGARTTRVPTPPQDWQFSGVLMDKAMHDALKAWAEVQHLVTVNDHLDRNLTVLFTRFDFTERRPSARRAWKGTYTMHGLLFAHSGGGMG